MQICNYCGRNLKKEYDTCPGCGSTSFKKTNDFGEKVIKTPPKGGYIINTNNFKKSDKTGKIIILVGWVLLIFSIFTELPFIFGSLLAGQEDILFGLTFSITSLAATIPFIIISIVAIIIGKNMRKKAKENINRVEKLAKEGILVKNMPYELVSSGTIINGQPIYCIQVEYENASNQKIPLRSEAKYDNKIANKNGTADLLIDPNDYSNYFIDIEIY
jgi:RNA polymerase subunit RPABC4/transcription elongation factor Spt4